MENLAEVIEKEVGVQVRQAGGLGSFSSVSLRGSTSDQVMVFMDGVLLNDASGGGVDLSNISLSDVEAVEIYRGVTPINFGRASIGGVVNIRTLRSRKGLKAHVSGGYGSFNTRKAGGFINHKPGKWDYLISADYTGSDNDFKFLNDKGTWLNPDDDEWERRHNAQFDQADLLAKIGYDLTDRVRLDFMNQWFSKDQHLPSWNNSDKVNTTLDTQRNMTTLNLIANDLGPLHLNTSTRLQYSWKQEEYEDLEGHIGLGREHNRYTTTRGGVNFFMEWLTSWNTLSLMGDVTYEEYSPEDLLGRTNPNDSNRTTFSAAIQDSVLLMEEALIITPAVRYTHMRDELESAVDIFGNPLAGRSRDEGHVSPQIGAKFRPLNWLTLRANVARYVREPSFFELFGDRGFFLGNPDLRAEKGVNFDIGFEANCTPENPLLKRVALTGVYFKSDVDDMITRVYDARGIGKSVNISEAHIDGIEAELHIDFLKYFRFVANATLQQPVNRSRVSAFNGRKLPGIYQKSYLRRIEGRYRGLKAYFEYLVEKGMYYDAPNLREAPDKKEANAGISWLNAPFLFTLEGKNLGDKQYEDFNGYPMPGRSFYFTVKYTF